MNVVIPPLFFYIIGAMFVVMGALRAALLGRRNPARELLDDTPERSKLRRRHLGFGVAWVLTGLVLIA